MNDFQYVLSHAKETKTLDSILGHLMWDQETMLPPSAAEHRGQQRSLLAGIVHEKKLDNRFFDTLSSLSQSIEDKNSDEGIIVQRLLEDTKRARKLPKQFVERFTETTSQAFSAWEKAKRENRWSLYEPYLERIVDLTREKATLLGYSKNMLDPLLDENDPGLDAEAVSTLFGALKPKLTHLLAKIKKTPLYGVHKQDFQDPLDKQIALCRELISSIQYDWTKSRLDTSAHPFSSAAHPTDSRITIRSGLAGTLDQALSALHEAGHSLYEMGLQQKWYGTPLCEAASLSIHESQSRFWEVIIGRSLHFLPHFHAILKKHSSFQGDAALLYRHLNSVNCSFIRTEADEVTYPFHVFLRFEIENELLAGRISVRDLPARWNASMHEMLGVTPPTDREGCLQDVHWAFGMFGYFPTYVLGSMYAACWWKAVQKDIPHIAHMIRSEGYAPLHTWLYEKVWRHGRRFSSKELVKNALGKDPSEDEYTSYLEEKYCTVS